MPSRSKKKLPSAIRGLYGRLFPRRRVVARCWFPGRTSRKPRARVLLTGQGESSTVKDTFRERETESFMFRLYVVSLLLTIAGAVVLGGLWVTVDLVLAEGEFVWAYAALLFGLLAAGFVVLLARTFASFEREAR